ncbi:hypothetical protein HNY73_000020 [Argiope bruennichi]|uniref:Uncharacterized protein n=1 Tax=Argiope bruennichi TaxID=94029 RepID=A0A8T0FZA1_ARGBR|nr:hypothetical protein HNY73_000020 [Argiope bruennichi]
MELPKFLWPHRGCTVCGWPVQRGAAMQHAVLYADGGHARRPRHVHGAPAEALPPPDDLLLLLAPHALPEVSQVPPEAAQRQER